MAIKIFVTRHFDRAARKAGLDDGVLLDAVMRAERGLVDANLGHCLIKQRIARPGQGRSGGYRTIIVYRKGDLAVFIFAYSKADQDNLSDRERVSLQSFAESFARFSPAEIEQLVIERNWRQVYAIH